MFTMSIADNTKNAVLTALRALGVGRWVSRADIAAQLGKAQLNGADILILEQLAQDGTLEATSQATRKRHILKLMYRLKEDKPGK